MEQVDCLNKIIEGANNAEKREYIEYANKVRQSRKIIIRKSCECDKCRAFMIDEIPDTECYVCHKGKFKEIQGYCDRCGNNVLTSLEFHMNKAHVNDKRSFRYA